MSNRREIRFSIIEEVQNQYAIIINDDCKMTNEEIEEYIHEHDTPWHAEGDGVIECVKLKETLEFLGNSIESLEFDFDDEDVLPNQSWEGHLKMPNDDILNELYNAQAFVLKIVNGDTPDIGEDEDALKSLDKVIDNFNPDGPTFVFDEDEGKNTEKNIPTIVKNCFVTNEPFMEITSTITLNARDLEKALCELLDKNCAWSDINDVWEYSKKELSEMLEEDEDSIRYLGEDLTQGIKDLIDLMEENKATLLHIFY